MKSSLENGGNEAGQKTDIGTVLNVVKSSPNEGVIKVSFNPTEEINVGDELELKVSLSGKDNPFEEIIWIKVKEKEQPKVKIPKVEEEDNQIGLPALLPVKEEDWERLQEQGIDMNAETVIWPMAVGDKLEKVYVNLDSRIFLNYKNKQKSENQLLLAEKRYVSAVYFHALFLYMITKKKNYKLSIEQEDKTIDEYIRDLFDSYYSDFLLNFGMEQLINSMED